MSAMDTKLGCDAVDVIHAICEFSVVLDRVSNSRGLEGETHVSSHSMMRHPKGFRCGTTICPLGDASLHSDYLRMGFGPGGIRTQIVQLWVNGRKCGHDPLVYGAMPSANIMSLAALAQAVDAC